MSEFFDGSMSRSKLEELRSVCAQCTVRHECLELALSFETDRDGVFGGPTPHERAIIRLTRQQNPSRRGA